MSLHEHSQRDQLPVGPSPAVDRSREQVKADRRRRAGVINRRIGWIILPMIIVASLIHWGPGGYYGGRNATVIAIQLVYAPLALVHAGLSIYVFGWVPWRSTLRVFHIWFGYAYVFFMLASQTSFGFPTVHSSLTAAMFVCLGIHVAIGARFAWRRREAASGRITFSD